MNVGHVVSSLGTGGAEAMLLRQIRYSDRNPTVFRLGGSSDLEAEYEAAGATIEHLHVDSLVSPADLNRARSRFREHDPDVLHAHLPYAMVVARLAGRAAGIDAVVSTHQRALAYPRPIRLAERATRALDSHEIAVSTAVLESQSTIFDRPDWSVIPNSIDIRAFHEQVRQASPPDGFSGTGPVFLNVGRYVPVKGQRYLIAAMRDVVDARPDAEAILVGHGRLREELEELIARFGLEDHVHVTGKVPVDEIHAYYAAADAFAFPSLNEGLPISVLEAMAAKLPVVGTRIPAVEEVVDEETAVLVEPRSASQLADAMLSVADADGEAMGERAYQRARSRFDISRTVAAHERLYERLADANYSSVDPSTPIQR